MYIIDSGTTTDLDFEEILLNEKPKKWDKKIKIPIFIKDSFNLFIPYSIFISTLMILIFCI
jgi:hypothetical protein